MRATVGVGAGIILSFPTFRGLLCTPPPNKLTLMKRTETGEPCGLMYIPRNYVQQKEILD